MSPSTRKAWIEIIGESWKRVWKNGRLPHGRCGLKSDFVDVEVINNKSPSIRKVWIEIGNRSDWILPAVRRLPHGRRGLKLFGL